MKNEKLEQAKVEYLDSKELVFWSYPAEYIEDIKTDVGVAFRKGAEWMAGQGCTVEIDEGYFINNPHNDRRKGKFHKYYSSVFGHSKEITVTPGDNLVVQIRKK